MTMSGSVDVATDVPERGLSAVLTNERVLFFGSTGANLFWWVGLDQIVNLVAELRWQNRVLNRGRETILTFQLTNGERFVGSSVHVVENKRRTDKFHRAVLNALSRGVQGTWR
ncbi:MAG: hypothetical protein ACI8Y4_003076 [Candidatus Poriferisodalaceae bacterium]|jgi:hypothetical protein